MKQVPHFEVFHHGYKGGAWYWRLRARNGNIVADGGEGYATKANAVKAAKAMLAALASVKEIEIRFV